MNENVQEAKRIALTLSISECDDFAVEQDRKNPTLAMEMVRDEFQEYVKTNDIRYLLSALHKVAEAKGWSELSRLSCQTELPLEMLYTALSEVLTNIIPFESQKSDLPDTTLNE